MNSGYSNNSAWNNTWNKTGAAASQNVFQQSASTGSFATSTLGVGASIQNGISVAPSPGDTVNDICINNKGIIASASWDGLHVWKLTINSAQTISVSAQEDSTRTEPMLRCTHDTAKNDKLYYGTTSGKIFAHDLNCYQKDVFIGHHRNMITGLKYSRDRLMVISSSPDGAFYVWDPRKPLECSRTETKLNCINMDVSRNTVALCGISLEDNSPAVKLYDFRRTDSILDEFNSKDQSCPGIIKHGIQFTSIALDRQGKDFIAATLGGFILSSTNNKSRKEYFFETPKKTGAIQRSQAINSIALITNPFSQDRIRANGCFIGKSDGTIAALSTFRTLGKSNQAVNASGIQDEPIKLLNPNLTKSVENDLPITACAVSPDGNYLVFARGDDYYGGFDFHQKIQGTTVCVRSVQPEADFKKLKL